MPGRHLDRDQQIFGALANRPRHVVLRQAQAARRERPGPHRPDRFPVWVSAVEPGSTHDITAARAHALPALYPAAAAGLPTLTDKGYTGAGIGILVPIKGHNLCADNRARNRLINALRAPAERANALLTNTWNALRRVTLDPWRIGAITSAALVLLTLQKGTR